MAISIVCMHATIIKRNDSHYSGRRTEVCGKIRGVGCLNVKLRVCVCVCVFALNDLEKPEWQISILRQEKFGVHDKTTPSKNES